MNKSLKKLINKTIYVPNKDDIMVEGFIIQSPYDFTSNKEILRWYIRDDISQEEYKKLAKEFYEETGSTVSFASKSIKSKSFHMSDGFSFFHTEYTIPFITVINVDIDNEEFERYLASEYYYNFLFDTDECGNTVLKLEFGYSMDIKLAFDMFLRDMGIINNFIYRIKFKPNCTTKGKSKLKIYFSKTTNQNIHDKITSSVHYHELLYSNILKHDITEEGIVMTLKLPKVFNADDIRESIKDNLGKERINRAEIFM